MARLDMWITSLNIFFATTRQMTPRVTRTGLWPGRASGGLKSRVCSFLNELLVPVLCKMSHLLREILLPRQTALPAFLISAKCLVLFSAGGQGHKSV